MITLQEMAIVYMVKKWPSSFAKLVNANFLFFFLIYHTTTHNIGFIHFELRAISNT